MVNEEIFQGLKIALFKKQSLKDAMESFYNAGYEKNEIEEAAKSLQMQEFQQNLNKDLEQKSTTKTFFKKTKPIEPEKQKIQEESLPSKNIPPSVSSFNQELKPFLIQKDFQPKVIQIGVKPKFFKSLPKLESTQKISKYETPKSLEISKEKVIQKVSKYEKTIERPKKDIMAIVLIIMLLLLVGILVAVFLFKTEIIEFFSNYL